MRVDCVGAVIRDATGRLLLIRRANPPSQGLWSLPGGRVEPGETDARALVREVDEETGLTVTVGPLVGEVRLPGPGGVSYAIRDYAARVVAGELRAGDDAADARWVDRAELDRLPTSPGLVRTLTGWGVLG